MNKTIEQLAEQAAEAVVAYDHDVILRVEHEEGATLEVPADFIFEFAKLIVRECAAVTVDYKNSDHYQGWLDHQAEILARFGLDDNVS